MKKSSFILALFFFWNLSLMATVKPVARIGNHEIPLSEFLHYYRQAERQVGQNDVQNSFDDFLRYKLKVADASERRMDTLPDFRRLCSTLQKRVIKDFFTDNKLADSYYHQWFIRYTGRRSVKEWVKMEIITYRLPQHPTPEEENIAARVMEELYNRLANGQSCPDVLNGFTEYGRLTCEYDGKSWIPLNSLLQEIIERKTMEGPGNYTRPFYSPLGLHVVRMMDSKLHISFEEALPFMKRYMTSLGADNPSLKRELYNQWTMGMFSLPEEVSAEMKEIRDGLLALFWDADTRLYAHEKVTSHQLEAFYRANEKKYRWKYPHFKGAVVHCADKKAASKIKKRLKKFSIDLWPEALKRLEKENSTLSADIACGIFQIGTNEYIDKLAFKCGSFTPRTDFPYTFILGKRLKKGPEKYTDVLPALQKDFRMYQEKETFNELFSRFKVEINQDVLKSVNSCGNK